jgi:hypothetical protein
MNYSLRTPHAPGYIQSVREILEDENRFLEETLDYFEHEDTLRGGNWAGYDMGDLIAHAVDVDQRNREIRADMRKAEAKKRLCRIIAMQYISALVAGDIDECDRLANSLVLATRTWCNG